MELSPASSNVGYFLIYPDTSWEGGAPLGESAIISRASAATIVADPAAIATADIYGFDWVPDVTDPEAVPPNQVVWENYTPDFFPYVNQKPAIYFWNYGEFGTPYHRAQSLFWFSTYAFGGVNTAQSIDGGVNALLVEVTAADAINLSRIGVTYGASDFLVSCSASADGGQSFRVSAGVMDFDEVFTRVKVWRLPTRIWPVEPPPPAAFWTDFVGAHEIV